MRIKTKTNITNLFNHSEEKLKKLSYIGTNGDLFLIKEAKVHEAPTNFKLETKKLKNILSIYIL